MILKNIYLSLLLLFNYVPTTLYIRHIIFFFSKDTLNYEEFKKGRFSGRKTFLRSGELEFNLVGRENYLAGFHHILDPFDQLSFSLRTVF